MILFPLLDDPCTNLSLMSLKMCVYVCRNAFSFHSSATRALQINSRTCCKWTRSAPASAPTSHARSSGDARSRWGGRLVASAVCRVRSERARRGVRSVWAHSHVLELWTTSSTLQPMHEPYPQRVEALLQLALDFSMFIIDRCCVWP